MRVLVTPSKPQLMHMPHDSAQNIDFGVAVAGAALCIYKAG